MWSRNSFRFVINKNKNVNYMYNLKNVNYMYNLKTKTVVQRPQQKNLDVVYKNREKLVDNLKKIYQHASNTRYK